MHYFLTLGAVLLVYMTLWFLVSIIKKRNDVADEAWGLGFVVLAWVSYFISGDAGPRGLLVSLLVTLWGGRLAWHIYLRHRGKGEDYRYATWRTTWKWFYLRSFFQVFILQGALLFLVVMPVLLINRGAGVPLGILDAIGFLVWAIGFAFESIGDAQLKRFLSDPQNKGKLMQQGLWAYSRHPNYFGEVTQWWGLFIVALSLPGGVWGIIGPLTISFLILKVSGVPMLEKKMSEHPDFPEYRRRVSVFVPLPPRR